MVSSYRRAWIGDGDVRDEVCGGDDGGADYPAAVLGSATATAFRVPRLRSVRSGATRVRTLPPALTVSWFQSSFHQLVNTDIDAMWLEASHKVVLYQPVARAGAASDSHGQPDRLFLCESTDDEPLVLSADILTENDLICQPLRVINRCNVFSACRNVVSQDS
eukprot:gene13919-9953_t